MPTRFVAYLNFGYCLPNSFQFAIKLNINLILNGTSIRTRSGYSDKIYRVVETVTRNKAKEIYSTISVVTQDLDTKFNSNFAVQTMDSNA